MLDKLLLNFPGHLFLLSDFHNELKKKKQANKPQKTPGWQILL